MEIAAYIINNLLLISYTILGGIDLGIGALIFVNMLFKKDNQFLFNIFNPIWEIDNAFLIFFIISFMFFFPKAIEYYSNILIVPAFIAIFFGFIRTSAYTYLHFQNRNSKIFLFLFGISSILMSVFLFSYYAINLRDYADSINFIKPTLLNLILVIFVSSTIISLGSSFTYMLIKNEDNIKYGSYIKNVFIKSTLIFIITLILLQIIILTQTQLINNNYFYIEIALIFMSTFLSMIIAQRNKILPFIIFTSVIIACIFNLMLSKFPKISEFSDLTVYTSFTNAASFNLMIISLIIGLIITIPGLIVFYKMFLSDKFQTTYDN